MPTDWENEDFRKLYEHPPPDFERLPFAVRCVAAEILRRCDRRGRIVPGHGLDDRLVADVAFHVRAHPGEEAFIRTALAALLNESPDPEECYLVFLDGYLTIRNFRKGQRSESAIRMARKRERDAGDESDGSDAHDAKTQGDAPSGLVSSGLSEKTDRQKPEAAREKSPFESDAEREVWEHWTAKLWTAAHGTERVPRATGRRLTKIRARLGEGFTAADLKRAIDAVAQSTWHLGENDSGKAYIEPETIFRNREKVDEWLSARSGKAPGAAEHERQQRAADEQLLRECREGVYGEKLQDRAVNGPPLPLDKLREAIRCGDVKRRATGIGAPPLRPVPPPPRREQPKSAEDIERAMPAAGGAG